MTKLLLAILAVFLPPMVVFLTEGEHEGFWKHFALSVALCLLAWIPAVLHAWYLIIRK